jgi:hypothetical protein
MTLPFCALKESVRHQEVGEIDGGAEHDRRDERSREQIQAHEDGADDPGGDDAANALEDVGTSAAPGVRNPACSV